MDWRDDELTENLHEGLSDAFSVEFADDELGSQAAIDDKKQGSFSLKEQRFLLLALVLSLCVHAGLAAWVLSARLTLQQDELPDFVEIQLIPSNPLLAEEIPEEVAEEEQPESMEELVEILESEVLPEIEEEILQEIELEQPLEVAEVLEPDEYTQDEFVDEDQFDRPVIEVPQVFVPSLVNVQESINVIEQQATSQLWAYDCDRIEEESELRRCKPTDRRNYASVERNSTYESLNPVQVLSQGIRTLGTVTSNAPALASRLRSSDLPEGLSDYVMEQVESGITHNTNPGNIAIENMDIMTENDAAAQARYIMNDPWVLNQEKVLRQRNVHAQ
jgi:hypothetical protein